MRLVIRAPHRKAEAAVAQVSFSEGGNYGAVNASEVRGAPVFAPRGIAYRPCEGDHMLVLPVSGADACIGVLAQTQNLAGGELRLASAGGAQILLENSGDIVLNGVRITRDGQIVAPQQL